MYVCIYKTPVKQIGTPQYNTVRSPFVNTTMALGAQAMAMAGSAEEEAALAGSAPAVVSLGGEGKEVVDPAQFWGDEERVKRELVAWAKAVASMAVHHAAFELQRCHSHRR